MHQSKNNYTNYKCIELKNWQKAVFSLQKSMLAINWKIDIRLFKFSKINFSLNLQNKIYTKYYTDIQWRENKWISSWLRTG
jgi:hypothetical protein